MMSISDKNTRTNITIPKDLKEQLEQIAKNQNRSFNNLLITILKSFVSSTQKQ
jgi:predicted HicB family RNase H-like nuclease